MSIFDDATLEQNPPYRFDPEIEFDHGINGTGLPQFSQVVFHSFTGWREAFIYAGDDNFFLFLGYIEE